MILFDHQLKALSLLQNGSLLHGGVGSGKSLTSIAYYFTKILEGDIPNGDCSKHSKPRKKIPLYIITTAAKRNKREWDTDCKPLDVKPVVIDSWNNIRKYASVKDAFFIFDEQKVVGSGTWAKHFIKLARNNRWILLSATPGDTWTDYIALFVANGFYPNRTQFLNRHAVYAKYTKYPKIERFTEQDVLLRYRRAITVSMADCRTTRRVEKALVCSHDSKKFDTIHKKRWNPFTDEPIKNASEMCYLLRKVVNSDDRRAACLTTLLKRNPKVIIFYNFDYELDILRRVCDGIPYGEWNGHNHDPVPTGDRWVYLVQYTAGAEGWNCITTNVTIFYSQNYSFKAVEQAMGRIDRINTPFDKLYYYTLTSNSPIDASISKALITKGKFNEKDFAGIA